MSKQGERQIRGGPGARYRHLPGGLPPDNPDPITVDAISKLLNYLELIKTYPGMNFVELRSFVPLMRKVENPSEELSLLLKGFELELENEPGAVTRRDGLVSNQPESLMQVLLRLAASSRMSSPAAAMTGYATSSNRV